MELRIRRAEHKIVSGEAPVDGSKVKLVFCPILVLVDGGRDPGNGSVVPLFRTISGGGT